jgi:hypothetical protein
MFSQRGNAGWQSVGISPRRENADPQRPNANRRCLNNRKSEAAKRKCGTGRRPVM